MTSKENANQARNTGPDNFPNRNWPWAVATMFTALCAKGQLLGITFVLLLMLLASSMPQEAIPKAYEQTITLLGETSNYGWFFAAFLGISGLFFHSLTIRSKNRRIELLLRENAKLEARVLLSTQSEHNKQNRKSFKFQRQKK